MRHDPVVWAAFVEEVGEEYADHYLRQQLQWFGEASVVGAAVRWMEENEMPACSVTKDRGEIVAGPPPEWVWQIIGPAESFVRKVDRLVEAVDRGVGRARTAGSRRRATRPGSSEGVRDL